MFDCRRMAYYGGFFAGPVTMFFLGGGLAARDAALDRSELASVERVRRVTGSADTLAETGAAVAQSATESADESSREGEEPLEARQAVTIALPYVPRAKTTDQSERPVPDVAGLTLRDAVRALHNSGFRVRLVAQRGSVTLPAAGTPLAPGSIVKLQHLQ
jgi:hypothetical protein